MKHVAVLGGGPAGSHAAECMARAGLRVTLLDEKLAWEKPCGGGITFKAYDKYPFLRDNGAPKQFVHQTWLGAHGAGRVKMDLNQPLIIYSRRDLNQLLLDRAERAGAQLEKTRVLGFERLEHGWDIRTREGVLRADFCVVATGARNPLREAGTAWKPADTMVALGYFVDSRQEHIDIQFLEELEGYIWVFPRSGHLSVGICGKGESARQLRARLERYMEQNGIPIKDSRFYAHVLPSLERQSWRDNRVSGDGWLAVGDSAGFVDPITGEGLYYAIRSGDLAAQCVLDETTAPEAKPAAYRALTDRDFARDLYLGSMIARNVYMGRFLFDTVPARMIHFIRRSPRFRALMQDLFAGTQDYETLRERLFRNLNGTLQEVMLSFFCRRVVPELSNP
ncbi:MAG: NAD(P)/FAD-dependent oxidoreductase [Bryobacteraceae bacterium]